jgi:hypothetical protein
MPLLLQVPAAIQSLAATTDAGVCQIQGIVDDLSE